MTREARIDVGRPEDLAVEERLLVRFVVPILQPRQQARDIRHLVVDRPGGFFSIKNSIEEWSSAQRMQGVKPVDYPLSPLSLENLARLGLISSSGILINGVGDANLTKIGFQFMYACEDPAVIKAAETELYKDPRVRRPTPAQPVKAGLPVGKKNG